MLGANHGSMGDSLSRRGRVGLFLYVDIAFVPSLGARKSQKFLPSCPDCTMFIYI